MPSHPTSAEPQPIDRVLAGLAHHDELREVATAIGIYRQPQFSDLTTLLASLSDAAQWALQAEISPARFWVSLADQVAVARSRIEAPEHLGHFPPIAVHGRWNHKLKEPKRSPVLETLLHRLEVDSLGRSVDLAAPLKAALLTVLLREPDASTEILDMATDEIRLMCLPNSPSQHLLHALCPAPSTASNPGDLLKTTRALMQSADLGQDERRKLLAIHDLLQVVCRISPAPRRKPWPPQLPLRTTIRKPSPLAGASGLDDIAGGGPSLKLPPSVTFLLLEPGRDALEPEDAAAEFEALANNGDLTPQLLIEGDAADHDEQDSAAEAAQDVHEQTSRFWLVRAETAVPHSLDTLLPDERAKHLDFLDRHPDSPGALLTSLSYALSLSLSDAAGLVLGTDLGSSGTYTRHVLLPTRRARTTPGAAHRPTVESIELALPRPVTDRLANLDFSGANGQTVAAALGIQADQAEEIGSAFLQSVPGRRANRISHHHLRYALRHRILVQTKNPLFAYLLTGRDSEAPAISAYYTHVPVSVLAGVYLRAVNHLFGVKS